MEKLNLFPLSQTFSEKFGIDNKRHKELLDILQAGFNKTQKITDILQYIRSRVETENEFYYLCIRVGREVVVRENPMMNIETEGGKIHKVSDLEGQNVWVPKSQQKKPLGIIKRIFNKLFKIKNV